MILIPVAEATGKSCQSITNEMGNYITWVKLTQEILALAEYVYCYNQSEE